MNPKDNPLLDPSQSLPVKKDKVVQPLSDDLKQAVTPTAQKGSNEAVEMLRHKIDALYSEEPNAQEELAEAEVAGKQRSKHQQFMHELSTSGKSLATIQTEWHQYYLALPDNEKHEVWQEFYAEHGRIGQKPAHTKSPTQTPEGAPAHKKQAHHTEHVSHHEPRSSASIKADVLKRAGKHKKKKPSHLRSLAFGLGMGAIVMVIFLFSFFNERFIAPFITPSKSVSNTPIIIDPASTGVGPESKIIIPKINVEIPLIYDTGSVDEHAIQSALEDGVVHYATTSKPGETGNGAIFGHSSNNILNKGKYKFAFVLLNRLEDGDVFYVQKDGKRYAYRVYKKSVVKPTDVSVLSTQEKSATMSLITCDPPGTSINRLVVVGEQISPDPGANVASTATANVASGSQTLPGNAPSLWSRLTSWLN